MPGQIPQTKSPDPLGLAVAREVQKAVAPATVILYGSRAAGDHRPDSDVDLMIIAPDRSAAGSAAADANRWLRTAGPDLDVNIKTLTQEGFDRRRRLGQSLAGQASRHGVDPMGERLEYNPQYDPHEEEIWEEDPDVAGKGTGTPPGLQRTGRRGSLEHEVSRLRGPAGHGKGHEGIARRPRRPQPIPP